MYNYPTGMYIFFYKKQHECCFSLIPAQPHASIGQKRKNVKNDFRNKKNNYKKNIEIHETIRLTLPNIPEGSKLIKSRSYTISIVF